jgi:hypothetical protein
VNITVAQFTCKSSFCQRIDLSEITQTLLFYFRYSYLSKKSKLIIDTNDEAFKINEQLSKVIKKFHTLLAYDWIHENIYFNSNNSIFVIGPINFKQNSFNFRKVLSHLFEIRSLTISPAHKLIFWLDIAFGTIESANLDGTERRVLVSDLLHAQALTIGKLKLNYHLESNYHYIVRPYNKSVVLDRQGA